MTDRRKPSVKKLEKQPMNVKTPLSKQQKEVLDWMRVNIPTKKTKFLHSHKVDYFIGSKAIDLLMSETSPWKPLKGKDTLEEDGGRLIFDTREKCVEYLDTLLRHKMFHRARKIPITDKYKEDRMGWKARKRSKEEKEKATLEEEGKTLEAQPPEKDRSSDERSEEDKIKEETDGKNEEKKKRKIRLDMHLDQMFVDSSDAFVWLYDPIPWYYWLLGGCICLVVITLCLFPLWPKVLRKGTQWISTIEIGFLVGVTAVGIFKYILFSIFYFLSGRKFRFWILPNLTKDVGFFGSFWPLYDYQYSGEIFIEITEENELEASDSNALEKKATVGEESDSSESANSAFEFIENSKDK